MQTETEVNKYISDLNRYGTELTAETLLGLMRVDADKVFASYGMDQPPSMSLRANNLLDEINQEIQVMVKNKAGLSADLRQLFRDRDMLKNFLAVHRTVWILEGKPL